MISVLRFFSHFNVFFCFQFSSSLKLFVMKKALFVFHKCMIQFVYLFPLQANMLISLLLSSICKDYIVCTHISLLQFDVPQEADLWVKAPCNLSHYIKRRTFLLLFVTTDTTVWQIHEREQEDHHYKEAVQDIIDTKVHGRIYATKRWKYPLSSYPERGIYNGSAFIDNLYEPSNICT